MKLFITLIAAVCLYAQPKLPGYTVVGTNTANQQAGQWIPPERTYANLPAAASCSGCVFMLTDAATAGSCAAGGGTARAICRSTGSAYEAVGDGSGGSGYDPFSTTAKPTLVDEFATGQDTSNNIGQLRWNKNLGTGGAGTFVTPTAGRPGIFQLTGGTAGNVTMNSPALQNMGFRAGDNFDVYAEVMLVDNDASTDAFFGVNCAGSVVTLPNTGYWIEKLAADTSWFGVTDTAGTKVRSSAIVATDTSWHWLRIWRVNATTIAFTIDGANQQTVTDNVAAGTGCVFFFANGGNTKRLQINKFMFRDQS